MVSLDHEVPLRLLRDAPETIATLMRASFGIEVPAHTSFQVASSELVEIVPVERRADLVLLARDERGASKAAVIIEVQREVDGAKAYVWPQYTASLHARERCPTWLVVICFDARVARWARRPIETFQPSTAFRPLVIGPEEVPAITDVSEASVAPELAVISALFHRGSRDELAIIQAALEAVRTLDEPRRDEYADIIVYQASPGAREQLEVWMKSKSGYEFKSDLFKQMLAESLAKGHEEGRAKGHEEGRGAGIRDSILAILASRGLPADDVVRAQLAAETEIAHLEALLLRAMTAKTPDELFA